MINGKRVVVIMPAYNAARTLEKTVRELPNIVDAKIVVDDRSTDETLQIAYRRVWVRAQLSAQPRSGGLLTLAQRRNDVRGACSSQLSRRGSAKKRLRFLLGIGASKVVHGVAFDVSVVSLKGFAQGRLDRGIVRKMIEEALQSIHSRIGDDRFGDG